MWLRFSFLQCSLQEENKKNDLKKAKREHQQPLISLSIFAFTILSLKNEQNFDSQIKSIKNCNLD